MSSVDNIDGIFREALIAIMYEYRKRKRKAEPSFNYERMVDRIKVLTNEISAATRKLEHDIYEKKQLEVIVESAPEKAGAESLEEFKLYLKELGLLEAIKKLDEHDEKYDVGSIFYKKSESNFKENSKSLKM